VAGLTVVAEQPIACRATSLIEVENPGMKRRTLVLAFPAVLALATAALTPTASAAPSAPGVAHRNVRVCAAPAPGQAACHAIRNERLTAKGVVVPNTTPAGYVPADLRSAYNLPSTSAGGGQVVAIVDAYHDPNALSDMNAYRSYFGIGALKTCTSTNHQPCFRQVNQKGGATYPRSDAGWAYEISLDLEMVSAVCPNCGILLVEASSNSFTNLGAAENRAATLKATEISNSWGTSGESSTELSYDSYFYHPGIAITASSGDSGYGVEYPAASPNVTAVGGTSLTRSSSGGWNPQTAWSGAGSGCSAWEPKPTWQSVVPDSVCANHRAVADVSAVADPNTGVAIYDTYRTGGSWFEIGGTSVASPLIASVYALAANASPFETPPSTYYGSYYGYINPYPSNLTDVTPGSNGSCGAPLCMAGTGWDGPTGLGTPNGTGGF
jgi:subtilase family serine protease